MGLRAAIVGSVNAVGLVYIEAMPGAEMLARLP